MYKITINKYEALTEQEKLERNGRQRGYEYNKMPSVDEMEMEQMRMRRELNVTLTDEQFQAVKKAVLEVM